MRTKQGEKEKLREQILLEALPSLKASGSAGTPVDKIMKKVGLTSGALYSHFKSKDDFFAQLILKELDRMIEAHTKNVEEHGPKTLAWFVSYYLQPAHIPAVEKGCIFAALGTDMHRYKPAFRLQFEAKIQQIFDLLAESLPSGSATERQQKVRFVFSSLVGTITFARTMKTSDAANDILLATKQQLKPLLH